jgi:MFS family permease
MPSGLTEAERPDTSGTGLWRNRNWRLFWLGQSVSVTGDTVFDVTVLLWVARVIAVHRTWAPSAASGVLIAAGIPALLVGPFAGVFVDRWNRRRTMLLADAARAVLVAALIPLALPSVASHLPRAAQLAIVYLVVAAAACFSQFFNPSRFAMLGAIVPEADVPKASSSLMSATYAAAIIGPPLAAPLLFVAGVQWALLINALSFAVSFLTIRLVRPAAVPALAEEAPAGQAGYWRELGAGLRFFVGSPVLIAVGGGLFITVLGAGALNSLNVFFIQVNLHSSASMYGTIGMAEGIGGVLGTLAAGWVMTRIGAGRVFWAGLILGGAAIVGYSRMSNLPAALAFIVATGLVVAGVNVALSPLLLKATPQAMIGRITSVLGPSAYLAAIISMAASGVLASTVLQGFHETVAGITFGPYDTIIGAGGLLFIAAGLAAVPLLRRDPAAVPATLRSTERGGDVPGPVA